MNQRKPKVCIKIYHRLHGYNTLKLLIPSTGIWNITSKNTVNI
jgi:hypothetical protein